MGFVRQSTKLIGLVFLLVGCGMFSGDADSEKAEVNPLIPTQNILTRTRNPREAPLVADMTTVIVERTSGGIILRTTGVAQSAAAYDVALTPLDPVLERRNILRLAFRARFAGAGKGGASMSKFPVAYFVSNQQLRTLAKIEITTAKETVDVKF